MPFPETLKNKVTKTPGAKLMEDFISQYVEQGHGESYSPTMADKVCAKKMADEYGTCWGMMMIDKFYALKRLNVPPFVRAPITLSCLYYNRNELVRLLRETTVKKDDNEF